MPDEKEPIPQFAKRIKEKYPEYRDVDDTLLTQKIIAKYPEYADMVDMSGIGTSKKKVGSVAFPESVSETPSTSKTDQEVISLANEFGKISGRISEIEKPIYTPGGGTLMPQATSRDKNKLVELEKSIKDAGYDPKEIIAEFKDFPASKNANIPALLQEKKENPLAYERTKAAFKWQAPLFNAIRERDGQNGEPIIQSILSGQSGSGYSDKRLQTKKAIEAANQYITDEDERRKIIQQISTDKAFAYGIDDEEKLQSLSQDPRYLGGSGLNKYQIQGLQFLEDTDPEKAKLYSDRVGQRPESQWGDQDVQRGYEYKARELESFGMQLELRALEEKMTNFANAKKKGELTPEQAQEYIKLGGQYETVLQDIKDQKERFPRVAAIEADMMYQEAQGQRNGALKRGLLGVGENVGDALNTINDFIMSPFRTDKEKVIDDLEDLGNKKFTGWQRYKTAANTLIDPDGKLNLTTGAVFNTMSDVGAEIASSIGIGSVTGMPVTKVGRIGSMFASTFATVYNDYYTEAIEKDIKNPTKYALLHSTKEALSELINNDLAVVDKAINPKSTLAAIARNIGKQEWDDISIKGSGRFTKALALGERIGKATGENIFKEDIEEVASQLMGNMINMGVYHEDVDLIDGVGATIVNTTLGTLPFAGVGVVGELRSMNRNQKYALYEAAQNKDKYLAQLEKDVQLGVVSPEKAEQIKGVINEAAEKLNTLADKGVIRQDKADNDKVDDLAEAMTSEDGTTKEEIKAAKILASANFPDTMQIMAEQDPIGMLKFIADQAAGGRRQDMIDQKIPENVINEAVKMFPPAEVQQEEIQQPSATEDVVPSLKEVSDAEYNDFIDRGKVSEERLNDIAGKVKNQQPLSDREKEIFTDKTGEVNKIIAQQTKVSPTEQAKAGREVLDMPKNWDSVKDTDVEVPNADGSTTKMKFKRAFVDLKKQFKQLDNVLNCI